MYPRSFLREEAKIKQRTPLKKELCEIGEEAIWESRFTSFSINILLLDKTDNILFCHRNRTSRSRKNLLF